MKYLYAFLDKVSGLFSQPFVQLNEACAVRYFQYVLGQSEMVAKDTALYCLGGYNDETGVIKPFVKFIRNYQVVENEKE